MRHLREIKKLPISELSDEEIVKAALHRLDAKMAMLVYLDQTNQSYFLVRYKNKEGLEYWKKLKMAWESMFEKFKKIHFDKIK